jgi:MYXO-CTERM domain-containing protein
MSIRKGLAAVMAAGAVASIATAARADIVPTLISESTSGGITTFTYNITFANASDSAGPTERIVANNSYVTVYDFTGYVTGSLQVLSGPLAPSIQLVGVTPPGVLPTDNNNIDNFTFLYTGPTTTTDGLLGQFSAESTLSTLNNTDNFTSHVTKNSGPTAGSDVNSIGFVAVPGPGEHVTVPEPGAPATLGLGLFGLGALGLLRRRRTGRDLAA